MIGVLWIWSIGHEKLGAVEDRGAGFKMETQVWAGLVNSRWGNTVRSWRHVKSEVGPMTHEVKEHQRESSPPWLRGGLRKVIFMGQSTRMGSILNGAQRAKFTRSDLMNRMNHWTFMTNPDFFPSGTWNIFRKNRVSLGILMYRGELTVPAKGAVLLHRDIHKILECSIHKGSWEVVPGFPTSTLLVHRMLNLTLPSTLLWQAFEVEFVRFRSKVV